MTLETLREAVKQHLPSKRFKHTLGVVKLSIALAEHYHEDVALIEIAALLHDYAKYEDDKAILSVYDQDINPVIAHNPNLGHGYLSMIQAKTLFNIEETCVLDAIEHHTFGGVHMTDFEKILYLADSLEENRHYDGVEALRLIAFKDLNEAVLKVSEHTILFEMKRGNMVHEDTIKMRNEMIALVNHP